MLDGAARIGDLFSEAARMGMPALATTDHGYVFGAYEFWKKAQGTGVKPIIGVEAYITPGTHRTDRTKVSWGDGGRDDVSGSGAYTHMTMLAENNEGMHNLFRMAPSRASTRATRKWPRIDRDLLSTYGKGLIVTTGCPSGEIQTQLRLGQYDEARESAARAARHLRQRELLRRADGPRARHRAATSRRTSSGSPATSSCRSSRPTTCTTPAPRTPRRTRRCSASSPARR